MGQRIKIKERENHGKEINKNKRFDKFTTTQAYIYMCVYAHKYSFLQVIQSVGHSSIHSYIEQAKQPIHLAI